MKHTNWLRIGLVVLLLAVVPLTGCVSKGTYQTVQTELEEVKSDLSDMRDGFANLQIDYATLEEEKSDLETELQGVEGDLANLQADYEALLAEYATLTEEKSNLEMELEGVQANYEAVVAEMNEVKAQLISLQADYEAAVAERNTAQAQLISLQSDLALVEEQLDKMEAAFGKLLFFDDFEDGVFDDTKGWDPHGFMQEWSVIQENDNYFLEGVVQDFKHIHASILDSFDWTDYTLEFRVALIREGFWVNFRATPMLSERYMLGISPLNVHIVKFPGTPEGTVVAQSELSFWLEGWNELKVEVYGANIKVYVNGALEIDYTDPEPLERGGINFEVGEYARIYVDDVLVTTSK